MLASQRIPYSTRQNSAGETVSRPLLAAELMTSQQSVGVVGLVDSGADVNLLPYEVGIALGLVWETHRYVIRLSGNMANFEARAVILTAQIGSFAPLNMAFAWTRAEQAPLIWGQTNFFESFNVCFYRDEAYFPVTAKA